MNWLQHVFGMDSPQPVETPDPDSVVHVATLPLWQTPMIITGLEQQGIRASFAEMSSPKNTGAGIPTARVYVVQRDRAAAEAIIADLAAP